MAFDEDDLLGPAHGLEGLFHEPRVWQPELGRALTTTASHSSDAPAAERALSGCMVRFSTSVC